MKSISLYHFRTLILGILFISQLSYSKTFVYSSLQDIFYQTVQIKTKDYVCSGLILNERQVLTAAHCALHFKNKSAKVYFNAVDKSGNTLSADIHSVLVHEYYKNEKQLSYDVAKVTLNNSIPNSIISKIQNRRFQKDPISKISDQIYLLGFGFNIDQQILKFGIKELSLQKDNIKYDNDIMIFNNEKAKICTGDSGGPLIAQSLNSNQFYLLGFAVSVIENKESIRPTCTKKVSFLNIESVISWF